MPDNLTLDATPSQPPGVSSQMGAGAEGMGMDKIAEMVRAQAGGKTPGDLASVGGVHPQGALITRVEAVGKVLEETARDNPTMAKYCGRAMEILRTGLAETIKMQKPGIVPTEVPKQGGAMAPPTGEASRGFIG